MRGSAACDRPRHAPRACREFRGVAKFPAGTSPPRSRTPYSWKSAPRAQGIGGAI
ncbi:hypothetical protein WN55_08580 [Dufourea novaeangliae]|uniref:Uncharacterized protein n=1 Tax=Dufourea novaeangliae TaxID=178035 RepID=A0A154P7M6_DUFNO|nr:hypothetical protein WN55_08580 [Dufourea novaeangliae]